ncbi:WGxxGxxG family protein [Nocardiopsis sp. NPDC058631]|uniref:WGxxGxxG family protein n=1 Tax=Nocardiopsis sp. NPDC058631 TaxID=3346566 RepID=UPI003657BE7D
MIKLPKGVTENCFRGFGGVMKNILLVFGLVVALVTAPLAVESASAATTVAERTVVASGTELAGGTNADASPTESNEEGTSGLWGLLGLLGLLGLIGLRKGRQPHRGSSTNRGAP